MEVEQMMACLLAEIRTNRKEIKTNQAKADTNQEEMLAKMEAKIVANQEKMDAWIAEMRAWRKETTACQEATETCLESKEPTSLEVEFEAKHEEEATMETFRALRKWYRDRHLDMGRCGKLKEWTQGDGGSRKTLAAVCRGMTRLAIPAWHKGHGCQEEGKDKAVPRTQKGWMLGKRHWAKAQSINGIRIHGLKKQLLLKSE
jgi:hypothetical protein